MLYCKKCGYEFEKPGKIYENHGMTTPPYEEISVCPNCKCTSISEKATNHCRCCGARLASGVFDYCSETCKEKGEKLRELERKRHRLIKENPLNEIVRKVDAYNREHNTNFSYGQYVAIILPKEKGKKKCVKKRKNI